MTIFGLLQVVCILGGILTGVAIGAKHAWWAIILGIPAGAVAGFVAYVLIALSMAFVAFGPKDFVRTALPAKWRRQKP